MRPASQSRVWMRYGLQMLCLMGLVGLPLSVEAQQTIFNVPSADVTPKGKLYLETESQFRPWNPNRFWWGTQYSAVGVGFNTEVDLTLANVTAPASASLDNAVIGVGFKSAIPILPEKLPSRELKLVVGELMPISTQGHGVGQWSYAALSGRIPKLNTRLTAGVNTGSKQFFGSKMVGFIGGYEQPVTKRLSLIGDWFSGSHAYGYFIPGFSYELPKGTMLFCGYQIPNNRKVGPSGFVIEISRIFF